MTEVAVNAHPDREQAPADNLPVVSVRGRGDVGAGTYVHRGPGLDTGWHVHDLHQLQYALEGVAEVETAGARSLLPPHQAMWIPAGCAHLTVLDNRVSIALFFDPGAFPAVDGRARVVAVPPVLREMLHYATRWPIGREEPDAAADVYFAAVAGVVLECLDDEELPLSLPTTDDALVDAIMRATRADLRATSGDVARRVGVSERTLRRRFRSVVGTTWSDYAGACRILEAIPLVVDGRLSVTQIAHTVGYGSAGTFTRAFRAHTGQTPKRYRAARTGSG